MKKKREGRKDCPNRFGPQSAKEREGEGKKEREKKKKKKRNPIKETHPLAEAQEKKGKKRKG